MSQQQEEKTGCFGWVAIAFVVGVVIYVVLFILQHFWAVIFLALVVFGIMYAANYRDIRGKLMGGSGVAVIVLCFFLLAGSTVWMVYDLKPAHIEVRVEEASEKTATPEEELPAASEQPSTTPAPKPASEQEVQYPSEYGGLGEAQRRLIYYELVEEQNTLPPDDPMWGDLQYDAYETVAARHGIDEDVVYMLVGEGVEKNWPCPPPRMD